MLPLSILAPASLAQLQSSCSAHSTATVMTDVASANPQKTGEIAGASSSGAVALANNTTIVVGGASGDLASRKVR